MWRRRLTTCTFKLNLHHYISVAAMPMRIDENNQPASASPSEAAAAKEGSDYKKKTRSGSSVGPGPRVKDPSRRAWWTRFLGKLLMISAAVLLEPHLPPGPNDLRHLIFAFGIIYAVLGCVFDVTAAFAVGRPRGGVKGIVPATSLRDTHCACAPPRNDLL